MTFRRVAILEPSLVYALPLAGTKRVQWEGETANWLALAQSKGADAVYARLHGGGEVEREVVEWLVENAGVQMLAPGWYSENAKPGTGLHFKSSQTERMNQMQAGIGGGLLMGQSCHDLASAQAAELNGATYIFLSPIFPTQTHPEAEPLGLEVLEKVCGEVSVPVYALGGVSWENEGACLEAGAAGIAGIRMFFV